METHYMKGGRPGDYPDFPKAGVIPVTPVKVRAPAAAAASGPRWR